MKKILFSLTLLIAASAHAGTTFTFSPKNPVTCQTAKPGQNLNWIQVADSEESSELLEIKLMTQFGICKTEGRGVELHYVAEEDLRAEAYKTGFVLPWSYTPDIEVTNTRSKSLAVSITIEKSRVFKKKDERSYHFTILTEDYGRFDWTIDLSYDRSLDKTHFSFR